MNPVEWKVYTLHGFNVDDRGFSTTDVMANLFRVKGYEVEEIDRHHETLLDVRLEAKEVVLRLSDRLSRQSAKLNKTVVIGHSHGANLVHQTMNYRAKRGKALPAFCVLINPALERKATFPKRTKALCYYSRDDNIVLSSMALDWLPWNWKIFGLGHPWGSAGKFGLKRADVEENLFNINLKELYPGHIGHSDVFYDEKLCNIVTDNIIANVNRFGEKT